MKKVLFFVLVITSFISQTSAQDFLDPVSWEVSLEKNTDDLYTILWRLFWRKNGICIVK